MFVVMALLVGALYAAAFYLLLARSTVKLIFGLLLISHAANLLIFTAAGLRRGSPPLVPPGEERIDMAHTDPLPPALILTAIVISFAIVSFACVLVKRTYQEVGSDDLSQMRSTES